MGLRRDRYTSVVDHKTSVWSQLTVQIPHERVTHFVCVNVELEPDRHKLFRHLCVLV